MVRDSRIRAWAEAARDVTIFAVGVFGILYETIWAPEVSEVLILLFAAMIGLPAFLRLPQDPKPPPGDDLSGWGGD